MKTDPKHFHMASVYKQLTELSSGPGCFQLIHIWFIVLNLFINLHAEQCQQSAPCICTFSNNSIIDLRHLLLSGDHKPVFSGVNDTKDGLISYSPCQDFTDPSTDECKSVALCRKNETDSSYTVLGYNENATFGSDFVNKQYILYEESVDGVCVQTYVYLICTPHVTKSSLTAKYINSNRNDLHLSSPSACAVSQTTTKKHPLSAGSILCIIYFSVLLGYFGTGIMYRRVVHEASGIDVLPHRVFWVDLPGLIRDGYLFFISPCLGNTVRYQAYHYEPL